MGAPSTMWRRHPFITSESCVHRRTRLRGTLFSHNWAMGGSAYSSRTVTLRDRYSSGLRSTRLSTCHATRSEEHTSELQSRSDLVCRLLLEKKKKNQPASGLSNYVTRA